MLCVAMRASADARTSLCLSSLTWEMGCSQVMRVLGGLQVLEKCLLLIFSTHPTYLPHLPKSTGFLCLPEVWDWLLGQPGLGL